MAEEEKKLTINKEEQNEAEDIQPVLEDEMKEIPGGDCLKTKTDE